ncbi:hypothetical protein BC826DRAFT_362447 [Russula brevipes]|nr:hypothetical protein BC826DRAFT_362447 [Russula brevipes]
MEDDALRNASLVLRRTSRGHRSVLPHHDWICGCFTWASYLTVFKPYRSIQASASALLWRRAYYLFVVVFPLLAFSAYLVAVLKTDSVHPVTDLHCDNSSPLWPRLLGYAGAPIVLYTPCFILSIAIALRIRWTKPNFAKCCLKKPANTSQLVQRTPTPVW